MQSTLSLLVCCGLLACKSLLPWPVAEDNFPYDLDHPSGTFQLSPALKEISGISISPDGKSLLVIQDELGAVYWLDRQSGEIIREVVFGQEGDFEGIEIVGNTIAAVKSSGSLFLIEHCGEANQILEKLKTGLEKANDVEGLAYDDQKNMLLLACKGNAGIGLDLKDTRAVYGFDLKTKALAPAPLYVVKLEDIQAYLAAHTDIKRWEKLNGLFTSNKESFALSPSGIAIHPLTRDLYILSSVGKLLLVLDAKGKIKNLIKLEKEVHPQPEGICFTPEGILYITNEGKEGPGLVHRFDP